MTRRDLRSAPILRAALLLLGVTAACGEPGARDPWLPPAKGVQAAGDAAGRGRAGASSESATAAPAKPARPELAIFRGAYRRSSTAVQFLPCGSRVPLTLTGDAEPQRVLRERWRWLSVQFERPLYVVVGGAIVRDSTGRGDASRDSAPTAPVEERFFVMRVDTVRAWQAGDCGLSRAPRW